MSSAGAPSAWLALGRCENGAVSPMKEVRVCAAAVAGVKLDAHDGSFFGDALMQCYSEIDCADMMSVAGRLAA